MTRRGGIALTVCVCLPVLGSTEACVGAAEPRFEARVLGAETFARSGPGRGDYYPTMALEPGQVVTVYGERTDDWIAILPPPKSFSWIRESAVEVQDDGTGKVVVDSVRVYVGSDFSDHANVFQDTLSKGAVVRIQDPGRRRVDGVVSTWYKILPTKNEVRYVSADRLRLPGAPVNDRATKPLVARTGRGGVVPSGSRPVGPEAFRGVGIAVIPPARPIRRVDPLRRPPVEARKQSATDNPDEPPMRLTDDPSLPFEDRLKSLRRQLGSMRLRNPVDWDIETARKLLLALRSQAEGVDRQAEVLKTLQQVDVWGALRRRYLESRRRSEAAQARDEDLAIMQRRKESQLRVDRAEYDAQGILRRAALPIGGRRAYKVDNSAGSASHFVLAPIGLNIEPYLGASVGLYGRVESRPGISIPILELEQLVPLR